MLGEPGALQPLLCWQGLWLCCRSQTHRTPSSTAVWRLMNLLQPSSHFLMNVHTVALGFGNKMEGRPHKSHIYEKLRVIKWRRLEEIKLYLLSTTYYEVKEMSKSHYSSKILMRFQILGKHIKCYCLVMWCYPHFTNGYPGSWQPVYQGFFPM